MKAFPAVMAVTCGTGDDDILGVLRVLLEVVTGIPGSRAWMAASNLESRC